MSETPRRGSLLVIFLTVFIDLLGFGMVLPLLPIYAQSFDVGASGWVLGLLMASFSAMQFLFAPLWGRLSDRIGRRPVLMVGLAGSVVFYTLFGIATVLQSIAWLFVARIGAGIAGATISTAQAYIADSTSLENRAKGMALIGAAFGFGFTLGPLLGGLALPGEGSQPGPGPGYVAAGLSALALLLALVQIARVAQARQCLGGPAVVRSRRPVRRAVHRRRSARCSSRCSSAFWASPISRPRSRCCCAAAARECTTSTARSSSRSTRSRTHLRSSA